jgi:hypothetical protein
VDSAYQSVISAGTEILAIENKPISEYIKLDSKTPV